jgi:hypothetical protein
MLVYHIWTTYSAFCMAHGQHETLHDPAPGNAAATSTAHHCHKAPIRWEHMTYAHISMCTSPYPYALCTHTPYTYMCMLYMQRTMHNNTHTNLPRPAPHNPQLDGIYAAYVICAYADMRTCIYHTIYVLSFAHNDSPRRGPRQFHRLPHLINHTTDGSCCQQPHPAHLDTLIVCFVTSGPNLSSATGYARSVNRQHL